MLGNLTALVAAVALGGAPVALAAPTEPAPTDVTLAWASSAHELSGPTTARQFLVPPRVSPVDVGLRAVQNEWYVYSGGPTVSVEGTRLTAKSRPRHDRWQAHGHRQVRARQAQL